MTQGWADFYRFTCWAAGLLVLRLAGGWSVVPLLVVVFTANRVGRFTGHQAGTKGPVDRAP